MADKAPAVIGGLLVAGAVAGGIAYYAMSRRKREEQPPPGAAEYRTAPPGAEYLGEGSWYKPPNIDIADGQPFAARLTFQHRGKGEMVQVCFRLNIQQVWQYVYGIWVTLPDEAIWTTHQIETLQQAINLMGLPECRGINGEVYLLNPEGDYLLVVKNADIYHTVPVHEYQTPVAEYWGS